ncbi:zinc finger protein 622 [Chrysoperla carnea]|uniref:zinc finger protein 622 n=1 Tax=Chrysoperla carnea TaxID=189513 RepID=UPI001D06C932|nr:zinc finger protein 622 [Chrysoperla carnea]
MQQKFNMTSQFTCITCRVAFQDAEIQRQHYKTDWHRYNLKRKVAELPSITSEEFQKRVLAQREKDEAAGQVNTAYCQACRKHFNTIAAYENHLNSKRHKDNTMIQDNMSDSVLSTTSYDRVTFSKKMRRSSLSDEENMEIEEVDSDEWDEDTENPIEGNNCLFCSHHSKNLVKNLNHMTVAHSFFIPDVEYCTDVKGLLMYLGEKVTQGYMCLWCNDRGKTFHSKESAQQHMIDKGHCKMLHEGLALAEYADYYDYSSSYPDAEEESVDADSEVSVPTIDDSDYQLVLPSGITVGHRSLMRYYKQSIDPSRQQVVPKSNKRLHKVLAEYRALGWTETQQKAAARKARDLHYMKRIQSKAYTKLGVKANKFQPHFRAQVQF